VVEYATIEPVTPRSTEHAIDSLAFRQALAFFLYIRTAYPHIPSAASDRFRGKSPLGRCDVVEARLECGRFSRISGRIMASIEHARSVLFR